ncbi:uncharacterized protein LOC142622622 [Castanea sativa]|uniref:uncharacterized protein LOC142622622 n=1 Tax=Castanea sativa TaxID=21020 RepID=UPI003F651419
MPSRGLRQGDSLSSYLFLLCAEGFTALLAKSKEEGRLNGVVVCRSAPWISHLLFADDSLLFCQASQEEVQCVTDILQLYANSSGQCINFEKSSLYFNSNTNAERRETIRNMLGVKEVDRFESYLGLPMLIGRSKYQAFSFLKDRVWKLMQGWKGKMLSRAGKEVLIKAVAQSIPTYTMGVFLLPAKLCNELNVQDFGGVTNRVLHPPVEEEWDWRVSDLIDWRTNSWDNEVVKAKFQRFDVEAILRIPLSHRQILDMLFWLHTKSGDYSVKSGYHIARLISKQEANMGKNSRECMGGVIQDPGRLNQRAKDYLEEFRVAQAHLTVSNTFVSMQNWHPPLGSSYKLNFNAAVFTDT